METSCRKGSWASRRRGREPGQIGTLQKNHWKGRGIKRNCSGAPGGGAQKRKEGHGGPKMICQENWSWQKKKKEGKKERT